MFDETLGELLARPQRVANRRTPYAGNSAFTLKGSGLALGQSPYAGIQHPATTSELHYELLSVPPRPHDGGPRTVAAVAYPDPQDLITRIGANCRSLVDLSPDGGMWTISYLGQSGQPGSKHYADQLQTYLNNDYYPMPISRKGVEAAAESRIRLMPDD